MSLNIQINDGFVSYLINNDPGRVLRFNASDIGLMTRFQQLNLNIKKYVDSIEPENVKTFDETTEVFDELDKKIKKEFDEALNTNASEVLFGKQSCMALNTDGQYLIEAVINALTPIIQSGTEKWVKESENKVSKYTAPYTKA